MKTDRPGLRNDEVTSDQKGLADAPNEGMFAEEDEAFWDMYNNGALAGDPTAYGDS